MTEREHDLLERIRQRCLQQRWHGPDMYNPFPFVEQERRRREQERERAAALPPGSFVVSLRGARYWYDRNGTQYEINLDTDLEHFPLQTDFEYAPATAAQVAVSEAVLGYRLPPLLHALYTTLANGGFGPGYGLCGIQGGFEQGQTIPSVDSTQEENEHQEQAPVNMQAFWDEESGEYRIPYASWPRGLFTLCHWGCGIFSYLDCFAGGVYRGEGGDGAWYLRLEATSLFEWLDLWAKGVDLWERMYEQEQEEC